MKRPKPTDKSVAQPAIDTNQDDGVFYPGDGLQMPGTIGKKTIKFGDGVIEEETRLPLMINDGKINDSGANAR